MTSVGRLGASGRSDKNRHHARDNKDSTKMHNRRVGNCPASRSPYDVLERRRKACLIASSVKDTADLVTGLPPPRRVPPRPSSPLVTASLPCLPWRLHWLRYPYSTSHTHTIRQCSV